MNSHPALIASHVLENLRVKRPLVLCLTNSVVQNFTANLLLAVGAVPVMLNHAEEIEDLMHNDTNALLINVGTLHENQAHIMRQAAQIAAAESIPWVLDPVAVGLLRFRTRVCAELIATPPAMIRGNASEILTLAGNTTAGRGPESSADSTDALAAAVSLACNTSSTVLVTGATDYMTDGHTIVCCTNGHELMTRVTGMGCAMGALAAACTAVASSPLHAAIATAAIMGVCGDIATTHTSRPGSLVPAILDALDELSPATLQDRALLRYLPHPR